MVGLTGVLMSVIGWQVVKEAELATEVGYSAVLGRPCAKLPVIGGHEENSGSGAKELRPGTTVDVTLDDDSMVLVPPNFVEGIVSGHLCRARQAADLAALRDGKRLILRVLFAVGIVLCLGLAAYGLKMTHRVAGPLHKIGLYFRKMKDGIYDDIKTLRKGDQLVEFYDHFKAAHAGTSALEKQALEQLREILRLAEDANLAARTSQLREVIDDIRSAVEGRRGNDEEA